MGSKVKAKANERRAIIVLFGVLVGLLAVAIGLESYNANIARTKVSTTQTNTNSPEPAPTPAPTPVTPLPGTDEGMILTAASSKCNASAGTNWGATLDNTPIIDGTNARVGVHCGGQIGGHVDILKKISSTWTVVAEGQQPPSKATCEQYDLPLSWCQSS